MSKHSSPLERRNGVHKPCGESLPLSVSVPPSYLWPFPLTQGNRGHSPFTRLTSVSSHLQRGRVFMPISLPLSTSSISPFSVNPLPCIPVSYIPKSIPIFKKSMNLKPHLATTLVFSYHYQSGYLTVKLVYCQPKKDESSCQMGNTFAKTAHSKINELTSVTVAVFAIICF